MTSRSTRLLAAVLALVALGLWLRQRLSPEAAVARALEATVAAVEGEKLLAVAQHISRSYSDPYDLTYESFLGSLAELFSTHDDIAVSLSVRHVSISGEEAAVELRFRVEASSAAGRQQVIGSLLEPAEARVVMHREHGDWLIYRVDEIDLPSGRAP